MPTIRYRYELWHDEKTPATGHLSHEEHIQIGDRIEIAGSLGIVRSIDPVLAERELRLVIDLLPSQQP